MTEDQLRAWLLDYAWLGTPEEREREVNCIIAQQHHLHLDAQQERYRGQVENPDNPAQIDDADEFALSALYECHDEPHQPTCPAVTGRTKGP